MVIYLVENKRAIRFMKRPFTYYKSQIRILKRISTQTHQQLWYWGAQIKKMDQTMIRKQSTLDLENFINSNRALLRWASVRIRPSKEERIIMTRPNVIKVPYRTPVAEAQRNYRVSLRSLKALSKTWYACLFRFCVCMLFLNTGEKKA